MITWSCLDALEDCFIPYRAGERTIIVRDLFDSEDFDERVGSLIERLGLDVESMGLISVSEFGVTFRTKTEIWDLWMNYTGPATFRGLATAH